MHESNSTRITSQRRRIEERGHRKRKTLRGFSSFLKGRALLPQGDGSRSCHVGINSCSNSNELGAQHV